MLSLILGSFPLHARDIKSLLIDLYTQVKSNIYALIERVSNPEYQEKSVYVLTCCVFLLLSVGYICYYYGRYYKQDWMKEFERKAYDVHIISGTINVSSDLVHKCKTIIEECVYLVNQPMKPYGFTPFLRACYCGNTELVKFMLKKGANIHSLTISKDSAIYLAAYRICKTPDISWSSEILDALFKAGCDLDVMKPTGHTALHLAARYGNISLVRWLLIHGANPNIRGKKPHSESPYEIASSFGDSKHQNIAALLHTYISFDPEYKPLKVSSFASSNSKPIMTSFPSSTPK